MKIRVYIVLFVWVCALSACSLTKFVPEDKYLLTKTTVKVEDRSEVSGGDLSSYLRQKPNTAILGFWHLQLDIYNTAPKDTTTKARKRLARNAHKIGEAPEIYDVEKTAASMEQIRKAMYNRGYFNARVDTSTVVKDRKLKLTYHVYGGEPYQVKRYSVDIAEPVLAAVARSNDALLATGQQFNTSKMDQERQRITTAMRRDGFFYFEKGMLAYEADSSYMTHEVTVKLKTVDALDKMPEALHQQIFTRYYIRHVEFHQDTLSTDKPLLRERVLKRQCRIRPGDMYSERNVEQTYANLNQLGPVKYVDIAFEPVEGTDSLDCVVTITRNKLNTVSAEIEGTYSAGDWGIAVGAGYMNKNLFRGAEQISLNGRVSHEWRQNGGRALEAKAEADLRWPNSLRVNVGYQYQQRPDEFTRTMANAGLYYTIQRYGSHFSHTFNVLDISYVHLPWVSDDYRHNIIDKSSTLRYSYEDHFIVDWSYTGQYSTQNQQRPNSSYVNLRYSVETAGNALYGICAAAKLKKNENDQYEIFNVPFAQYAKADINFTYNQVLVPDHRLVYHAGIGVAVPFVNASVLPFEKRYFSGGSNSVRGWQARTLGPGGYRGKDGVVRYDMQAGDIRLDLNLEYRYHVWNWLHLAAFTDAGNIWTIRDYDSQPHGCFYWNEFYKQIAWAYGVGVRLDLTFLIFRVDFGVKLYDPTRLYTDGKVWRTASNGLGWKDDMTFHFAIGYPF